LALGIDRVLISGLLGVGFVSCWLVIVCEFRDIDRGVFFVSEFQNG
jgi:hypothetical protein